MRDLIRDLFTEFPRRPSLEPRCHRVALPHISVVRDAQEVVEWDLGEYQVADVENPDLGHVECLGDVELFPHCGSSASASLPTSGEPAFGKGDGIDPFVVPRSPDVYSSQHIDSGMKELTFGMVIQPGSAGMLRPSGKHCHHVPPVVIGEHDGD